MARATANGHAYGRGALVVEPLGRDPEGPRFGLVASPRPIGHPVMRRLRMIAAVARQGFALCAARDRQTSVVGLAVMDRSLEPLLPGFLSASAAMTRVVEQIQRLQGNDLTVLITGESGTGKELVARAIHVGSHRSAGDLPALQLHDDRTRSGGQPAVRPSARQFHRRGLGPARPGADRGRRHPVPRRNRRPPASTCSRSCCDSSSSRRSCRSAKPSPSEWTCASLAATNADLEQRVAEGKFREDLYYRLAVIRIHVPPLRERREEIPHLSTYFLREALERLGKPDTHLSSDTLDVFAQYWWPGNVRQLKNEIQRAVALSAPGGTIEPSHLSPEITTPRLPSSLAGGTAVRQSRSNENLARAVEEVEREMIQAALDRTSGNISETARGLGLTRRGLYLKLRRLGLDAGTDGGVH